MSHFAFLCGLIFLFGPNSGIFSGILDYFTQKLGRSSGKSKKQGITHYIKTVEPRFNGQKSAIFTKKGGNSQKVVKMKLQS